MALEKLGDDLIEEIRRLSQEGYTQKAIAQKLGLSTGVVSKYAPVKKKTRAGYSETMIENLCEALTPLIAEKLRGTKPSDSEAEGGDRKEESKKSKEEEMSDGDVEARIQDRLDREKMLEKLKEVPQLREDLETMKKQVGQIPEKLAEQLTKFEAKIEAKIENGAKETADLCKLYPDLCKKTEAAVGKKIEEMKPKGVLGTDLKLNDLMKDEKSQRVLVEKYLGPAGLVRALELCTGSDCAEVRRIAKERGINLQRKREGGGMLGGDWEDLD